MLLSADCRVKKGDAPSPKPTRACASAHGTLLRSSLAQLMRAVNCDLHYTSFAAGISATDQEQRQQPWPPASTTAGRCRSPSPSRSRWVVCPGGAHHPHPAGRAPATARRRRARSASPDHAVQRRAGHLSPPHSWPPAPKNHPARQPPLLAFRFVRSFFHFASPTRSFVLLHLASVLLPVGRGPTAACPIGLVSTQQYWARWTPALARQQFRFRTRYTQVYLCD